MTDEGEIEQNASFSTGAKHTHRETDRQNTEGGEREDGGDEGEGLKDQEARLDTSEWKFLNQQREKCWVAKCLLLRKAKLPREIQKIGRF